jgi:hypothetical protein
LECDLQRDRVSNRGWTADGLDGVAGSGVHERELEGGAHGDDRWRRPALSGCAGSAEVTALLQLLPMLAPLFAKLAGAIEAYLPMISSYIKGRLEQKKSDDNKRLRREGQEVSKAQDRIQEVDREAMDRRADSSDDPNRHLRLR